MEDRLREHGSECDRIPEQHAEQVERDRAEQHAGAGDEANAGHEAVPARRLGGAERTSDRPHDEDGDERQREQAGGRRIDRNGLDGEDDAAERRACDHSDLPCDAAQRERTGQQLARDELGREGPQRGIPDDVRHSGNRGDHEERPQRSGTRQGHENE